MTQVNYVMRKKDNKYIITRYFYKDGIMTSKFWVNTYYENKNVEEFFNNIYNNAEYYNWNIIKDTKGENIRELIYTL